MRTLRLTAKPSFPFVTMTATAVAVGAVSAVDFRVGLAISGVLALAFVVSITGHRVWWWLSLGVLAGAMILDYGFANVGVPTPAGPLPLADLVLLILLIRIALSGDVPLAPSLVFAFLFAFVGAARLVFDLPRWGPDALRDMTLPLEVGYVVVGYWLVTRYGREQIVRLFSWVFVLALPYFLLFPLRDKLQTLSPDVGIQQVVPLLGHYQALALTGSAGLLFFAIVRPFGRVSYLLAAAFAAPLAMTQARGVYLALPLALCLVWLLARNAGHVRRRIGITVSLALVSLVTVFALAPEGRRGPVTTQFFADHVSTLVGGSGPDRGTLEDREWIVQYVVGEIESTPGAWLVGAGLGPDLAPILRTEGGRPVRKPHNDYLEILARMGALGLLLFVAVLATSLGPITRAIRLGPDGDAPFLLWIVGVSAITLLLSATQPYLSYPHGTIPLFTLLGAGLALATGFQRSPSADRVAATRSDRPKAVRV